MKHNTTLDRNIIVEKSLNSMLNDIAIHDENDAPEIGVWKSVILQAVIDATSRSAKRENIIAKKLALKWLNSKSQDFYDVCMLANLNPYITKIKIKRALENVNQWKRKAVVNKKTINKKIKNENKKHNIMLKNIA